MWHRSIVNTIEQIKKRGLCLYGAGFIGEIAYKIFEKLGQQPVCYCDDDYKKQGQIFQGIPVLSVDVAVEKYPDAVYIPCADSSKKTGRWNRSDLSEMIHTLKRLNVYDSNSELRIEMYLFLLDINDLEEKKIIANRESLIQVDDIKNLLIFNHMSNSGSFYFEQLLDGHPNILCLPYSSQVFWLVFKNRLQYLEGEELLIEMTAQMLGYLHSSYENLYCVQNTKFHGFCVDKTGNFIFDVLINPNDFLVHLRTQFYGNEIKLKSFGHMMKIYIATYNNCLGRKKQEGMEYWLFYHMHKADYDIRDTYKEFSKQEFERVENLIIIREPVQQCYSYIRRMVIKERMNIVLTKDEDFIHTLQCEMGLTLRKREGIDNVKVIRFEDLKYRSERTLKELCKWMQIPYKDSLCKTTLNGSEIYFPTYTPHGIKYITGNDTSTVGQKDFSETFTLWDETRLNIIYAKFKRAYGYECPAPDFTKFSKAFQQEMLKENFKFCDIVQQVLDEDGLPEDHYDVNQYVKELYQTYMDTYDDNTEYYDYIKPEADEE